MLWVRHQPGTKGFNILYFSSQKYWSSLYNQCAMSYIYVSAPKNWNDANADCIARGGTLFIARNAYELSVVRKITPLNTNIFVSVFIKTNYFLTLFITIVVLLGWTVDIWRWTTVVMG